MIINSLRFEFGVLLSLVWSSKKPRGEFGNCLMEADRCLFGKLCSSQQGLDFPIFMISFSKIHAKINIYTLHVIKRVNKTGHSWEDICNTYKWQMMSPEYHTENFSESTGESLMNGGEKWGKIWVVILGNESYKKETTLFPLNEIYRKLSNTCVGKHYFVGFLHTVAI